MQFPVAWNRPVVRLVLAAGLLMLLSCGPEDPGADNSGKTGRERAVAGKEGSAETVQLLEVDLAGLKARLGAHRGKVVLVDIWATWCRPCVKAWPKLVRIADEYDEKGLAVLTLSTDAPEKAEDVVKFLQRRGAPGESLLLVADNYDEFVRAVGREWEGGVPALLLYDRAGELQHELLGAEAAAGVEERIKELLADGD
jgi:thiol-disulfide isomerase/thioredoxin